MAKKYSERTRAELESSWKFNREAYDAVTFRAPKGSKEYIKAAAEESGVTYSEYMRSAIIERMIDDGHEEGARKLDMGGAALSRNVNALLTLPEKIARMAPEDVGRGVNLLRHTVGMVTYYGYAIDKDVVEKAAAGVSALPDEILPDKAELLEKIRGLAE